MQPDKFEQGRAIIEGLWGRIDPPLPGQEELHDLTIEHLFGRVWSRPNLAIRDRSLITVAALAVLGRERNLRTHLAGALKAGVGREEIVEMMIHLAHYAGWPCGVVGLRIAGEVFAEADQNPEK